MNTKTWNDSATEILIGTALSLFHINIPVIGFILNTAGVISLYLGSRALRKESRAFSCVYVISIISLFKYIVDIILRATYLNIIDLPEHLTISYLLIWDVILLVLLCSFASGVENSRTKAGMKNTGKGLFAIIIWFLALNVLTLFGINANASILNLLLFIAFILIVIRIFRTIHEVELEESTVPLESFKIPGPAMITCYVVIALSTLLIGNICFCKIPGDWRILHAEAAYNKEIADNLLELGFPELILKDMSEEDLIECAGADKVLIDSNVHKFNDTDHNGSVFKLGKNGTLTTAQVAVRVPGEENDPNDKWYIIEYFYWPGEKNFPGNEIVDLGPDNFFAYGNWTIMTKPEGKVLYDKKDLTYISDIKYYKSLSNLFNLSGNEYVSLSFPRTAVNARGYIVRNAVSLKVNGPDVKIPFNYYHQSKGLNYPLTAPYTGNNIYSQNVYRVFFNSFKISAKGTGQN